MFKIKHDYDHKKVFNTLKVQHKKRCEDKCYCYFLQGHYFKHYQHGCKVRARLMGHLGQTAWSAGPGIWTTHCHRVCQAGTLVNLQRT